MSRLTPPGGLLCGASACVKCAQAHFTRRRHRSPKPPPQPPPLRRRRRSTAAALRRLSPLAAHRCCLLTPPRSTLAWLLLLAVPVVVLGRAVALNAHSPAKLATSSASGPEQSCAPANAPPRVLLVSLDGFRAEYVHQALNTAATQRPLPALRWLAEHGSRAQAMTSVFPSVTFPNHWSIATGLCESSESRRAAELHIFRLSRARVRTDRSGGARSGGQLVPPLRPGASGGAGRKI